MKKFLLSLMALFAVTMAATATEVTIEPAKLTWEGTAVNESDAVIEYTATSGDITLIHQKNSSSNFVIPSKYDPWRFYNKTSLIISSEQAIKKVVFNFQSGYSQTMTFNDVEIAPVDNVSTWTGEAASVNVINTASKQARVKTIVITYGEAEPETQVAKPVLSLSSGTYYGPIEVACTTATEGATIMYSKDGGETYHQYELPIAIGTSCELEVYATKDGLQDSEHVTAQYTIAEPTIVNSIAEANAEAENGTVVKFANPVTCVYQNDAYTYVKDATGYTLLYGKGLPAYTNGSVVPAGFFGKMTIYNDLIEFTTQLGNGIYTTASFTESTESVAPVEPAVVKVADVTAEKMNQYVKIESVTYNAADKTLVDGENKLVVYNRFKDVELPEDGTYTVTGFVSIFNGTVQIYPTAFETPSGVEEINAAAQEDGQVYNLLGQPVSADTKDQILVKNGKKFINK